MQVYNSTISGNVVSKDAGSTSVSKDGFLKILTAQLRNQDPTNAKDGTEYVAQMAQFSALEQMQNLNTTIEKLLSREKFQEGNLMLGKIAKVSLGSDKFASGEVKGTKFADGVATIVIDGKEYNIDGVVELSENVVPKNVEIAKVLPEVVIPKKVVPEEVISDKGSEPVVIQNN